MQTKQTSIRKKELFLIFGIVLLAAIFALGNRLLHAAPAAYVEVSIVTDDSKRVVLETFDLNKNIEYEIVTEPLLPGEPDGTNHLIIQDGFAWISEANCPNHDCVKKGKIRQNGDMLVCIPHRLTVTIVGESAER